MENIFTAGKHCLMTNDTTKLQNSIPFLREITCFLFMKKNFCFFLGSFSSEHIFVVRMLSSYSSRFKTNTEKYKGNKLKVSL